jgi:hypothetical protein
MDRTVIDATAPSNTVRFLKAALIQPKLKKYRYVKPIVEVAGRESS